MKSFPISNPNEEQVESNIQYTKKIQFINKPNFQQRKFNENIIHPELNMIKCIANKIGVLKF